MFAVFHAILEVRQRRLGDSSFLGHLTFFKVKQYNNPVLLYQSTQTIVKVRSPMTQRLEKKTQRPRSDLRPFVLSLTCNMSFQGMNCYFPNQSTNSNEMLISCLAEGRHKAQFVCVCCVLGWKAKSMFSRSGCCPYCSGRAWPGCPPEPVQSRTSQVSMSWQGCNYVQGSHTYRLIN